MSRIGKQPIVIPDQVSALVEGQKITVKGPKGELNFEFLPEIKALVQDNQIIVTRKNDEEKVRSLHGLTRALIANMVTGVKEGFAKKLEPKGIGYKAEVQGGDLVLNVGFSHTVKMAIPEGLAITMEKNIIVINGIDKQKVGQFAASVRMVRPPEPYKGKGIRYTDEIVKIKPGKQAAKAGGTT